MTHDNGSPYNKLSSLVDNFSGPLSSAKWNVYTPNDITTSVGGRLQFFNNSTTYWNSRMDSVHLYSLDSGSVRVEVGAPPRFWMFSVRGINAAAPDAGYRPELRFTISDGLINASVLNYRVNYLDGDVQIDSTRPYDPVTMAYMRFTRSTEGRAFPQFEMQFSPDGVNWQNWVTFDPDGPGMDPVSGWRVEFYANTGVVYMSDFNSGGSRMRIRTGSGSWISASSARIRGSDGQWHSAGGRLRMRTGNGTWVSV